MAILIDTSAATEGAVFQALLEIARCDPGLTGYQSDPGYVSVFYTQKNPGVASSNRLLEIAKSVETVVISGVDDTFQIGSRKIIDSGAWTVVGTSSDDGCQIYVDVTDAGGLHYCDLDAAGNKIYSPLCVTLYHELAHAYHYLIKGDAPLDLVADQQLAIADENAFRAQLELPLRNPVVSITDSAFLGMPTRGGLTIPACKPPANGASLADLFDGTCIGCNIATAALGSPVAREIAAFRTAKRDFGDLTLNSVPLLEPMMNSYKLFSPMVAGEMRNNPVLRETMLHYGVQPAVHLLRIVQTYTSATTDDPAAIGEVERSLSDYVSEVTSATSTPSLAGAAADAFAASRLLATADGPVSTVLTDQLEPENLFSYVAATVRASGAEASGPAWIVEGLAIFLHEAANRCRAGTDVTSQLLPAVGAWLARVPVPQCSAPNIADLPRELKRLAERLFPNPANRKVFAQRLLARWPHSAISLDPLLDEAGYFNCGSPHRVAGGIDPGPFMCSECVDS
jgi:hypothetical protein